MSPTGTCSWPARSSTWSAAADEVARASAADTGGTRHFRFVTDAICSLDVDRVTLSTTGDDNFDNTVAELVAKGYDRPDRKYLVYVDANVYCGIGEIYYDDSPNATPGSNANNGHSQVEGMIARVDNGCWGQAGSVEAHELMHNLGGVQPSAPHATPGLHCTDENDRMCYADGSGGGLMQLICALLGGENRFDCNHDDYFSTNPPAGSYLATHWNTANSVFLATAEPVPGKGNRGATTATAVWATGRSSTGRRLSTPLSPASTVSRPVGTTRWRPRPGGRSGRGVCRTSASWVLGPAVFTPPSRPRSPGSRESRPSLPATPTRWR